MIFIVHTIAAAQHVFKMCWLDATSITHEAAAQIKRLVANVNAGLRHVMEIAQQLDKPQRWFALVRYIVEQILACQPAATPVQPAAATG